MVPNHLRSCSRAVRRVRVHLCFLWEFPQKLGVLDPVARTLPEVRPALERMRIDADLYAKLLLRQTEL